MRTAQSILTACVLLASSSVVQGRYKTRTSLNRRDAAQTITIGIDPSPTITGAAVSSAYSVYSQKCGVVLNSVVYDALSTYVEEGGDPSAAITADGFREWADEYFPWQSASGECTSADNDLAAAEGAATSTTNSPPPTTTQFTTAPTTDDDGPTGSPTGSFTGVPSGACTVLQGFGTDFPGFNIPGCSSSGATSTPSGPVSTSRPGGGQQGNGTQTSGPGSNGASVLYSASILALVGVPIVQAVWWN